MAKRVTIQLDVPRELRFDGVALMRLEELTGKNVVAVLKSFTADDESESRDEKEKQRERALKFSFKTVAQIVQAGVCEDMPHASTEEIIRLMDKNGKGNTAFQRVLSYAEKVFGTLSDSVGADEEARKAAKNERTGPEKK